MGPGFRFMEFGGIACLVGLSACGRFAASNDELMGGVTSPDASVAESGDENAGGSSGMDGSVDTSEAGEETDSGIDGSADDGGDAGTGGYPARPPDRPDGGASPQQGKTLTFAVRRVFFGSIDPSTEERTFEAWRQFGFDMDGFCTTAMQSQHDDSGVCKKPPAASILSQEDGSDCRDNTVGHLLSEVMKLIPTNFERVLHNRSDSGTAQLLIFQLLDVGDEPDDPYAPARLYVGVPTKFPPLWNGTDVIPVDKASVLQGLGEPKYRFESGYIRNNMWISGDFAVSPAKIPLSLLGEVVETPMDTVTIAIQLDDSNAQPRYGMMSAVLRLEDVVSILERAIMEATDCNQALAQIALASYLLPGKDLASGGVSFVNPAVQCDCQSLGQFFELATIQPPMEVVAVEPYPPKCP